MVPQREQQRHLAVSSMMMLFEKQSKWTRGKRNQQRHCSFPIWLVGGSLISIQTSVIHFFFFLDFFFFLCVWGGGRVLLLLDFFLC